MGERERETRRGVRLSPVSTRNKDELLNSSSKSPFILRIRRWPVKRWRFRLKLVHLPEFIYTHFSLNAEELHILL
jgi:hypothetical protein